MENVTESLGNMEDRVRRTNIYLTSIPEWEGRDNRRKRMLFKEIMTENFQIWQKKMNHRFKNSHWISIKSFVKDGHNLCH